MNYLHLNAGTTRRGGRGTARQETKFRFPSSREPHAKLNAYIDGRRAARRARRGGCGGRGAGRRQKYHAQPQKLRTPVRSAWLQSERIKQSRHIFEKLAALRETRYALRAASDICRPRFSEKGKVASCVRNARSGAPTRSEKRKNRVAD